MDGWRDLPAEELELHVHVQPNLIFDDLLHFRRATPSWSTSIPKRRGVGGDMG